MRLLFTALACLISVSVFGQDDFWADKYEESSIIDFEKLNEITLNTITSPENDLLLLPCFVSGQLDFYVFDTGCESGLNISENTFTLLLKNRKIKFQDYLGDATSIMADGSKSIVRVIVIDEVIIGKPNNAVRLKNVLTTVSKSEESMLLLGQDIIKRFSIVAIDHTDKSIYLKK